MDPLKIGIIGCGKIGSGAHIPDAKKSPLLDLVALADLSPARVKEVASTFEVQATYTDEDKLLEDPNVEAVVLALPTGVRTPVALKALAKGKHILLEKPVAMNLEGVDQILAAQGDRVAACCSSRFGFKSSNEAATEHFASGALGQIREVRCRALFAAGKIPDAPPPPWRQSKAQNGGGILVNWGCYDLDFLMYVTGWSLKPKTVLARCWPIAEHLNTRVAPGSDAESHYHATILCEDGIILSLERAEFSAVKNETAWQIIGTEGSLRMQMVGGKNPSSELDGDLVFDSADAKQGVSSTPIPPKALADGSPNLRMLEDFARAIREGKEPRTNLKRARIMQQLTDAIYRSSEEGRAVDIEAGV